MTGAHPRACGENWACVAWTTWPVGSSPRVRGKRAAVVRGGFKARLIPARAGKTRVRTARPPRSRAHPRACGENIAAFQPGAPDFGSSPRVRGKPHARACPATAHGLIPARAGKTSQCPSGLDQSEAHPRACGENRPQLLGSGIRRGSSPRVREKHTTQTVRHALKRLIPARAGKTSAHHQTNVPPRAHPRACGENPSSYSSPAAQSGSSPRVRGKLPSATR